MVVFVCATYKTYRLYLCSYRKPRIRLKLSVALRDLPSLVSYRFVPPPGIVMPYRSREVLLMSSASPEAQGCIKGSAGEARSNEDDRIAVNLRFCHACFRLEGRSLVPNEHTVRFGVHVAVIMANQSSAISYHSPRIE